MQNVQTICKGCGQPIWGSYLHALGAVWHPEHFVCTACARPIGNTSFQLHQDAPYHAECYNQQIAPRCAYCGKPLVDEYFIDHWGQQYCKAHQDQYQPCDYCGRLISPDQMERKVDTIRCPICRSSSIEADIEAKPLFSQAIRWVSSQGLTYNNLRLELKLCDRQKLAQLLQGHSHMLGATFGTSIQNGSVMRTEVNGIAVLQGLPATLFQGVTVHELGHVWLIVQGIRDLPAWAEEGFCELLSYRYYNDLHTQESIFHSEGIEQNPNPTYGDGFRRIRALSDALGFPRFLEILRTTKRLPSRA